MDTLIFKILCGILYLIGLLFERSYEQISVDICINACPIICIACAFLTGLVYKNSWTGRIGKSFNFALGLYYYFLAQYFWEHYNSPIETGGDTHAIFMLCKQDLEVIAESLNCSYEQINLDIYCHMFFGIVFFHLLQVFFIMWRRKRIQHSSVNSQTLEKQ